MKSIREFQYDNAMVSYVNLLRLYSESPSMSTIEKILANVEYSTTRMPMCGNYRLEPYVSINDRYLNSELELIRADSNTIISYLTTIEKYLRTAEYIADTWCRLAKRTVTRARERLFSYTSDVITNSTTLLNIQDTIDTTYTTMMYQNGLVVPNQTTASSSYPVFIDQDVTIKPTSTSSTNTITGGKTTVFNPAEYGNLTLDAEMATVEECGFIIGIRKAIPQVNSAILEFISNTKGIRIVFEVSTDGRIYSQVYNKVCWDLRAVIPFGQTSNISAARITITTNVPTVVSDSSVLFEFKIHKISFVNIKNAISNVFQTKRIPIAADVKLVAPVIDADISNADMNVKISTDADEQGNAVGFVSVSSLPDGAMRLDSKLSSLIIPSQSDTWNLTRDTNYSATFFNLFSSFVSGDVDNADYRIENGSLVFTNTADKIIPASITLRRGMKDYLKSKIDITSQHVVTNLIHSTEYVESIKWFKALDLKVTWTEIITPSAITSVHGSSNNAMMVSYYVANNDQIRVFKEDGTEVVVIVSAITKQLSGTYLIEFATIPGTDLLGSASNYHVTYVTTINELYTRSDSRISVDIPSFLVTVAGDTLTYGTDFTINSDLWKLVLLKTGKYTQYTDVDLTDPTLPINASPDVVVSFSYTMTPQEQVYRYSTYVVCSSEIDIVIKPFSPDEIAQGNYHMINGTDVSQLTNYTLPIGENCIETTQPYSSCNAYDLNTITQATSSAAIIIPDNIDSMYAYKDTMRQISPFILGTLNEIEGYKCFAFDNNRLLLNFQPDFVDPIAFEDETQSAQEGSLFTCKRPTYDSSYINRAYSPQPEIFELVFSYISDAQRYISLRLEVECDSPDSYVSISKIGFNELREG